MSCKLVRLIVEPPDGSDWRTPGLPVVEDVSPDQIEQKLALLALEGNDHITQWEL